MKEYRMTFIISAQNNQKAVKKAIVLEYFANKVSPSIELEDVKDSNGNFLYHYLDNDKRKY